MTASAERWWGGAGPWLVGAAAAVGAVTVAVALDDPARPSPWRHAYFVPVVALALRLGAVAGVLAAVVGILAHAPVVLPRVERDGLSAAVGEGLTTFGLLLLGGALVGTLATRGRRQRARYDAVLAVQRTLAGELLLDTALERIRSCLAPGLGATALAIVARDGERLVVAGDQAVTPGSAAAAVLAGGASVFVPDTGDGPVPRRVAVVPLLARGETVGVLALEREGELDAEERAALAVLGAHLGLALENARLASRQRRHADELARRVEEATRARSMFVAVASHELRTPLTALQGFAELLATRRFPPEEVRRLADIIRREAERLARIVSDLLDLSRLERGLPPSLRRAAVPVEPALRATAILFEGQARAHRLDVACEAGLPAVDADPDALDRILRNLVSNAIKYSPPGSAVRLAAQARSAAAVEISVADDGPGIPAAAQARLFEPYYRAPGAAVAAAGSGIGLAIVKALVEAHGGAIEVESAPGRGTRLAFVLPVAGDGA